jgi:hypothetical protein
VEEQIQMRADGDVSPFLRRPQPPVFKQLTQRYPFSVNFDWANGICTTPGSSVPVHYSTSTLVKEDEDGVVTWRLTLVELVHFRYLFRRYIFIFSGSNFFASSLASSTFQTVKCNLSFRLSLQTDRIFDQETMKPPLTILLTSLPFSSSFSTLISPPKATFSLGFNGLEFDEADMNEFVDKRAVRMDPLGINDEFVRKEYAEWLIRYNKLESEARYKLFKQHLLQQLEFDSDRGEFSRLNEFGDFTQGNII